MNTPDRTVARPNEPLALQPDARLVRDADARQARRRVGHGLASTVVLAAVYLPYAWILLVDHSWGSHRWHWIASWPGLPLRIVLMPWIQQRSAWVEALISAAATAPLACGLVWLAARGRHALILVGSVALLLSALNSGHAYVRFLF